MMAGMTCRAILLLFVMLPLVAGCTWSVNPILPPVEPPPNIPDGVLLFTVPVEVVAQLDSPTVRQHLEVETERLRNRSEERLQQVMAHQIVTGMTSQELVWAFRAHPTRIIDQGSPGGHTLLWGQRRAFDHPARYWVRLDEWGHARSAGRY